MRRGEFSLDSQRLHGFVMLGQDPSRLESQAVLLEHQNVLLELAPGTLKRQDRPVSDSSSEIRAEQGKEHIHSHKHVSLICSDQPLSPALEFHVAAGAR